MSIRKPVDVEQILICKPYPAQTNAYVVSAPPDEYPASTGDGYISVTRTKVLKEFPKVLKEFPKVLKEFPKVLNSTLSICWTDQRDALR